MAAWSLALRLLPMASSSSRKMMQGERLRRTNQDIGCRSQVSGLPDVDLGQPVPLTPCPCQVCFQAGLLEPYVGREGAWARAPGGLVERCIA